MRREVKVGIAGLLYGALLAGCGGGVEQADEGEGEDATEAAPATTEAEVEGHRGASTPAAVVGYGHAVAYGGGKYFAVWADMRTGGIYGTRVKPDGTVLDPKGIRINFGEETGSRPAIAFNGTHFFVVWGTINGVDGVRVTPDGTVVGPMFSAVESDEAFDPARVACSPKVCLVTYSVSGDAESVIRFTRVSKGGVVLETETQSLSAGTPNVADDASPTWNNSKKEFLVVWSSEHNYVPGSADIHGNRVKEDGTILDGKGFPISTAEGAQTTPAVVWTGKSYQVVWSDDRNGSPDIYGARVSGKGTVKDPDGIPISTEEGAQTAPRIAHHNSKSLVVWDDTRYGPHSIWGARWGEDGAVWDGSGFPISSAGLAQQYLPDVAFGAGKFFTVYDAQETYSPGEPHYLVGTRVTHQAQVKDVPAVPLTRRR